MTAAQAEGVDPQGFLEALDERGLTHLAVKPLNLKFLLGEFARQGGFSGKLTDLYRSSLLQMCRERREELASKEEFADVEKLAVAERLAAISVFSGVDRFWLGEREEAPAEAVHFAELAYGEEPVVVGIAAEPDKVKVSEKLVKRTFDTSLFTSRGSEQLGWADFKYAEFLAASYISSRCKGRSVEVLREIGERDGRLVPQVRQTAAWAASLDPAVHKFLLEQDKDVLLLRDDLELASDEDREALVNHVLVGAARGREFSRQSFRGLMHPRLADQIGPMITDKKCSSDVRRVAIDVAESCRASGTADALAEVALDATEAYPIRCNAATAVARIGDAEAAERLRPLLDEDNDDPKNELRGAALEALWKLSLTVSELVSALRPPRSQMYFGTYQVFLGSLDFSDLPPTELAVVIDWAAGQRRERGSFDSLMNQIAVLGLRQLDDPDIASATARLFVTLLQRDRSLATMRGQKGLADLLQESGRRRKLVSLLIPSIAAEELRPSALLFSGYRLLLPEDAPWLQAESEVAPAVEKPVWEQLLGFVSAHRRPVGRRAFDALRRLRDRFSSLVPPPAKTRVAQRAKADRGKERLDIEALLASAEEGAQDAWLALSNELIREASERNSSFASDIAASASWQEASATFRRRFLEVAIRNLDAGDPETEDWWGQNFYNWSALAGYRSLRLLLEHYPERLGELPSGVWAKWAPIIVAYPAFEESERLAQQHLVARAYEEASSELLQSLDQKIELEEARDMGSLVLRLCEETRGHELEAFLASKVNDESLSFATRVSVLAFMLDRGSEVGQALARSLLPVPPPPNGDERQQAVEIAVLLISAVDDTFDFVWPVVEADKDFGRALVAGLATSDRYGSLTRLDDEQLATIYIWTEREFPHAEDPEHEGVYSPTDRDDIGRWRWSLLSQLEERATQESCRALKRISEEFPSYLWMNRIIERAEQKLLTESWIRPEPRVLIELSTTPDLRYVADGNHLLDVLVESLDRFQKKLVGETPLYLWDVFPSGKEARPWDEGRVSDWLKVHLESDLAERRVIANREVEIRRTPRAGLGSRIDIKIEVLTVPSVGEGQNVSAVIEVKGCWNDELEAALTTQLVEDYLKKTGMAYSLYVVAWFDGELWSEDDGRRRRATARSREDVQSKLEQQAQEARQQHSVEVRVKVIDMPLEERWLRLEEPPSG